MLRFADITAQPVFACPPHDIQETHHNQSVKSSLPMPCAPPPRIFSSSLKVATPASLAGLPCTNCPRSPNQATTSCTVDETRPRRARRGGRMGRMPRPRGWPLALWRLCRRDALPFGAPTPCAAMACRPLLAPASYSIAAGRLWPRLQGCDAARPRRGSGWRHRELNCILPSPAPALGRVRGRDRQGWPGSSSA